MSNKVFYKVLLVDDNKALGTSLQPQAERYSLDLQQCECWEDAKQVFSNKNDFLEWDAIILDARCVDRKGSPADLHFLQCALRDINVFCERYNSKIPWYVLTAGGKEDFEFVMEDVRRIPRDEKEWGKMLYFKDKPCDENGKDDIDYLFENIQKAAPLRTRNKIKQQYSALFEVMKSCQFEPESEDIMISVLSALHFPEENKGFDPVLYYNRLRQMVEYLFRAANKIGLLPDYFIEGGKVNLQGSSLYLDDKPFTPSKDSTILSIRYGEEGERVFHKNIASIVKNVLSVTSHHSHTIEIDKEDEKELLAYYLETRSPNLLFGYALQLCEVIIWFGNYAKSHNDREANLAKCKVVKKETESILEQKPVIEEYEGKTFLLEQDEKRNLHCGYCLVSYKQNQDKIGNMVLLKEVEENKNSGELKKKYPYFASKVEQVE
jgi:hypothetical protein